MFLSLFGEVIQTIVYQFVCHNKLWFEEIWEFSALNGSHLNLWLIPDLSSLLGRLGIRLNFANRLGSYSHKENSSEGKQVLFLSALFPKYCAQEFALGFMY